MMKPRTPDGSVSPVKKGTRRAAVGDLQDRSTLQAGRLFNVADPVFLILYSGPVQTGTVLCRVGDPTSPVRTNFTFD